MKKIKVGIAGCAGFSGLELFKILSKHPGVEIVFISSERFAGKSITEFLPLVGEKNPLCFENLDPKKQADLVDAVFFALPTSPSLEHAAAFAEKCVVIDLSAAFRLKDVPEYEQWYKEKHIATDLLSEAVYGLVEWNREKIKSARIIANPGCYPTSALLPLLPLIKANFILPGPLVIDSKSGVSGMGRKVSAAATFMEINENFRAYGVGNHRHSPEITQEVILAGGDANPVIFTPHLLPLTRGILSTIYIETEKSAQECQEYLTDFYRGEPFIKVGGESLPDTARVSGTNLCWFSVNESLVPGRLIIVSAIDNLFKGAAGQAVQNFNVRFDFDEDCALV